MKNATPIFLILLSIGIFYTFTKAEYDEVKSLQALSGEYNDLLDNASEILEIRGQLISNYQAIPTENREALSNALPDNTEVVRMALNLDGLSALYGVTLRSVQSVSSGSAGLINLPSSSPVEKTSVAISFNANYLGFVSFLRDLERSLRIIDTRSLSFRVNDVGIYEYRLTFDTYWLKP
ncbi:MAG: hypothetical protein WDZ64_01005 [Parcubacteria group bacterium]